MITSYVPEIRAQVRNAAPIRPEGRFVLLWMIAARRIAFNFSLQRAVDWARGLHKPLVIFEPLRCDYRWASDRLHRFVLQGMANNRRACAGTGAHYYPYVEPAPGADRGLLAALAAQACVIVTDEFPCFFLPRMIARAVRELPVRCESLDSNGLLPLRATESAFPTAHAFRRFLQKQLKPYLTQLPLPNSLQNKSLPSLLSLPAEITERWPAASDDLLSSGPAALEKLPLDHQVGPALMTGGSQAAGAALDHFMNDGLSRYLDFRSHPEEEVASGLSPYLHFGHLSVHEIWARLVEREGWTPECLSRSTAGSKAGWWGLSPAAEAFLDELVTWRELGYNFCHHRSDYDRYESLPNWAQTTLAAHASDPRPHLYSVEDLAAARTHDPLWNAAQRQLVREGRMHNYLRMLWGKKILEWSPSPREALAALIELNNRFAVDGRDPNSYSGIFWILGRYDRPWGPERQIYGKVRYMSSENTARKFPVSRYLARYSEDRADQGQRTFSW